MGTDSIANQTERNNFNIECKHLIKNIDQGLAAFTPCPSKQKTCPPQSEQAGDKRV